MILHFLHPCVNVALCVFRHQALRLRGELGLHLRDGVDTASLGSIILLAA